MRTPLPLLLASLIVCAPAQAEFLMLSIPDASATQDAGTPAPHPKLKRRPPKTHLSASEPALSGFGDQVPLTFAVRQIVPANFQVAYADTVKKDAPVNWKGGEHGARPSPTRCARLDSSSPSTDPRSRSRPPQFTKFFTRTPLPIRAVVRQPRLHRTHGDPPND